MTLLSRLQASDYQRTRWRNGGGWTTQIAVDPAVADGAAGGEFRWRVSIADIEHDGPFSPFPGIERDLLLLEGHGIELDIGDAPPLRLTERFAHVHFAGEANVSCHLLAGPTRDFNVMTRRDAVRADVFARPLVGPMAIFPEAGVEWLVHVFSGHANARSDAQDLDLESGNTLHIDFGTGGSGRVMLDGGGELVFVKFLALGSVR